MYGLLKDGVKAEYYDDEEGDVLDDPRRRVGPGEGRGERLPAVSQLWVAGELYTRRADLVGFVNGLPLLFVELRRPP